MNNHKNAPLPPFLLLLLLISPHPISASNPTPLPPTNSYWTYFKAALHPIHSFFFPPPNLDFRGGNSDDPQSTSSGEVGGGGGGTVTRAATKSLEKTKSAVEESAKSAAKLAKDAVQDTAQMVKDTLSDHHPHPPEDSQDNHRSADL